MIEIKNLSKSELVLLTNEILIKNEYLESCVRDKDKGIDKLARDRKQMDSLVDRLIDICDLLTRSIEEKGNLLDFIGCPIFRFHFH